jgi:hypothetical protein
MSKSIWQFVERALAITSQQLELCCHRATGNIPSNMRRGHRSGSGAN